MNVPGAIVIIYADQVAHAYRSLALGNPVENLYAIANGISVATSWENEEKLALVVDGNGRQRLLLTGFASPKRWQKYNLLAEQLRSLLARTRFVSYEDVENAAMSLADKLGHFLKRVQITDCEFLAVPRGGYFALGMLSYLLELSPHQLVTCESDARPLVIVDDCCVSGYRLGEYAKRFKHRRVILAPVYAHPAVCAALADREHNVMTCINGENLRDVGSDAGDLDHANWKRRWQERTEQPHRYYWWGYVEHLCFPWSEPDVSIWNPYSGKVEDGWSVAPLEHSLRLRRKRAETTVPVQVMPESGGAFGIVDDVIFADFSDEILIANLCDNRFLTLRDVAADIWREIARCQDIAAMVARLQSQYEVNEATLIQDIEGFFLDLSALGLLHRDPM